MHFYISLHKYLHGAEAVRNSVQQKCIYTGLWRLEYKDVIISDCVNPQGTHQEEKNWEKVTGIILFPQIKCWEKPHVLVAILAVKNSTAPCRATTHVLTEPEPLWTTHPTHPPHQLKVQGQYLKQLVSYKLLMTKQ